MIKMYDYGLEELQAQVTTINEKISQQLMKRNNEDYGVVGRRVNDRLSMLRIKQRRILSGHFEKIYAAKWLHHEPHILSISNDSKMIKWNGQIGGKMGVADLRAPWNLALGISPNDNFAVIGGLDNLCTVYSVPSDADKQFELKGDLMGHTGYISQCDFLTNNTFVSGSGDATARLWDVEKGVSLQTYEAHTAEVLGVTKIDENSFATSSVDKRVLVWDARTGDCTHWFECHTEDVNEVKKLPNNYGLISASNDCTCKLLDLRYGGEIVTFKAMEQTLPIACIAISSTGRLLFSAGEDQYCTVWDVAEARPLTFFQAHENIISSLDVSPDGYALCTASWDKLIRVWTLKETKYKNPNI